MTNFATIYEQEYQRVFSYLLLRSENWHVAEDLASDVFVVALGKFDRWEGRDIPYSHYLRRIAYLLHTLHWKKERRRATRYFFEREDHDPALMNDGGIGALLDRCETAMFHAMLKAALPRLRVRPRQAIILRYGLGLPEKEAARRMGVSFDAYHACLQGAEQRLRQLILGKEPKWTQKNAKKRARKRTAPVVG